MKGAERACYEAIEDTWMGPVSACLVQKGQHMREWRLSGVVWLQILPLNNRQDQRTYCLAVPVTN